MNALWRGIVTACAGGAAGMLAAQALPPAQQRAPDGGPDILVEGGVPRMLGGRWRFTISPALTDPVPGRATPPPTRGQTWERCIDEDDTMAILDAMIGQDADFDGQRGCSRLSLAVHGARLTGGRRCSRAAMSGLANDVTSVSGRIARERLTLDYRRQTTMGTRADPKIRWQIVAVRTGACSRDPSPDGAPAVAPVAPIAVPELEPLRGVPARSPDATATPAGAATLAAAATAGP